MKKVHTEIDLIAGCLQQTTFMKADTNKLQSYH